MAKLRNNRLRANLFGLLLKFVTINGIILLQLALWLVPILRTSKSSSSSICVVATVDLYTSEVNPSDGGAINSLAFPSILGGSVIFDTIYSTYNTTGIMAIGAALLAAGGLFALRALPDPETLNTRLEDLQKLITSKPLPFGDDLRIPIQKGHIRLPKLHKPSIYSTGYQYNRDYREDGEHRNFDGVAFGPPLLPPVTNYRNTAHPPKDYMEPPSSKSYPIPLNSIDSVNPFKRQRFPYNPPTSSTIIPAGYNTFDPQSIFDTATTTRSAPPTRGTGSKSKDYQNNYHSDFNLGSAPGPPYFKDMELQDYLELQLNSQKNNEHKDESSSKNFRRKKPFRTDGEIILEALKDKTRDALRPVVEKIKDEIRKVPKVTGRIKKGWQTAFGARRKFAEADLDDTYYYDGEEPDGNKEDVDVYEYYEDNENGKKGFDESYYIRDNVIIFPKSKLDKSKVHRVTQNTDNQDYDYNYDYADGNYPRRIPATKKKPERVIFDTSIFYKK